MMCVNRRKRVTDTGGASKAGPLALVPEHAGRFYDCGRELYNLTAMHKASSASADKAPYEWLRLPNTVEFLVELERQNTGQSRVIAERGRTGGTWAHWQVAVAYAKYLSPAFHIQWNEYAAAYLRGEKRADAPQPSPSQLPGDPVAAIEQIKAGLVTLFAPAVHDIVRAAVEAVVVERFGVMPEQVAETHAAVKGATRIEIVEEVTVDGWASDGYWYIAVNARDNIMSLSETTKDPPALRLENGDYNGNKAGDKCWVMVHSCRTDKRKKAQEWMHQVAQRFGCRKISGDRYVYDLAFVAEAKRITGPIRIEAMKQQAVDQELFLPPLFRDAL